MFSNVLVFSNEFAIMRTEVSAVIYSFELLLFSSHRIYKMTGICLVQLLLCQVLSHKDNYEREDPFGFGISPRFNESCPSLQNATLCEIGCGDVYSKCAAGCNDLELGNKILSCNIELLGDALIGIEPVFWFPRTVCQDECWRDAFICSNGLYSI